MFPLNSCFALTYDPLIPINLHPEILIVDKSGLSGTIPSEIGLFSNLRKPKPVGPVLSIVLKFHHACLRSLLVSIEDTLGLHQTRIRGGLPTEVGMLTNLKEIIIGGEGIKGSIPSEIGGCTNMSTFGTVVSSWAIPIFAFIYLFFPSTDHVSHYFRSFHRSIHLRLARLRNCWFHVWKSAINYWRALFDDLSRHYWIEYWWYSPDWDWSADHAGKHKYWSQPIHRNLAKWSSEHASAQ